MELAWRSWESPLLLLLELLLLLGRFGQVEHGRLDDLLADLLEGGADFNQELMEPALQDLVDRERLQVRQQPSRGARGLGARARAGLAQDPPQEIVDLGDAEVDRARERVREDQELGDLPRQD